jgi:hypothetical protein
MNENENDYKLTLYEEQLKSLLRKINMYNTTGRIGARPIPTIDNLFKTLTNLKDSINLVKEQEHAINGGLVSSANETKADELIKKYVKIRDKIDETLVKKYPRTPSGGQRSKIKKRRFKSNKSKGRKRTSRRRRISRKRSKKC